MKTKNKEVSCYRGFSHIFYYCWGKTKSLVIPWTSLYGSSLNRGSTVAYTSTVIGIK